MAWIELHQGLREHRKLFACADELKVDRMKMVGILVCIWLWALDNASSGSLDGISNRTIARVCDWPEKKADGLIAALVKTGWLDDSDGILTIHDWTDYAGKLMERREKDRERKKKGAEGRKNSEGIPTEATRNSCATVPNRTLPYPTVPICGGGDGDSAREATADELSLIGLVPGVYLGLTSEDVQQIIMETESLVDKHMGRGYVPADCRVFVSRVFFGNSIDRDRLQLLDYALGTAAAAGHPGEWAYAIGVMDRLAARNIRTVQEAMWYDMERPDKEEL
jgi:hypothetical protein